MILLAAHGHPTIARYADPHLGRLVQPRSYGAVDETARAGIPWAADNDAFGGWDDVRQAAFLGMLAAIAGLPGCLFVTAPDVVGDAAATLELWRVWAPRIRAAGLPVALVAQDGLESPAVPWDELDALFIGGTTEFKLGAGAAQLVAEAEARGRWVHMGRVNSMRRLSYAASIGCGSVDGSGWTRWEKIWLPRGLAAVKAGRQERLLP